MLWISQKFYLYVIFACINGNFATDNGEEQINPLEPQRIQSRMLEVFMHLPSKFENVHLLKNKLKDNNLIYSNVEESSSPKSLIDVNAYEIVRHKKFDFKNKYAFKRFKREVNENERIEDKPVSEKLISTLTETEYDEKQGNSDLMLPIPEAVRGPMYSTYPIKEFDTVDVNDPDYLKRRKNDTSDVRDDNSQRDKRTFGEGEPNYGDSTTPTSFWKKKKENPSFVTGRGSSVKNNDYTPPQHRTAENPRESHSLKDIDNTSDTKDMVKQFQDNHYSSSIRRAFSRQSDRVTSSTPKSVYDTIDYSKKNQGGGGTNLIRHYEDVREPFRKPRPTHEQFTNRQYVYNYPVHERPYYQTPSYPSEIVGRGVEYYHQTFEPSSGRIIYYANMPENGRSLDYRYVDSIDRNYYSSKPQSPPITFEPFYKNFIPPQEYSFLGSAHPQMDFSRMGRSYSQAYSYPNHQDRDRYQRDPRFTFGYDKGNSNHVQEDNYRNKTYIIFDADDNTRSRYLKNQFYYEPNRQTQPPPPPPPPPSPPHFQNYQEKEEPFRVSPFQPSPYINQPRLSYRNEINAYSPPPPSYWNSNQGSIGDYRWPINNNNNNNNYRPEVHQSFFVPPRNFLSRDLDKNKKA